MSAAPPDDTLLRRLLALEVLPDQEFGDSLRTLWGADLLVLIAPTPAGAQQVLLSSGLPGSDGGALAAACAGLDDHPLLAYPGGPFRLETREVATLPLARLCPRATWCLTGVGEHRAWCALWLGSGSTPTCVAADELLATQLARVIQARVGDPASGAHAAAAALTRLSHEVKTPLVSIKGYAELILDRDDGGLDPRVRQWVSRIAGGANRLAALFRRATAEARSSAADSYEARPVDVAEWVRRCVTELRSLAGDRQLRWEWHAAQDLPQVLVDPEAAQDLLLELLQNAARATPDGGRVVVEAAPATRHQLPGVEVSVVDSGVGFPIGTAGEQLFERFSTLAPLLGHHSGEFEFGAAGLGLGLAMARGVARAHGGELLAEGCGRDEQGLPGARFRVWLPRADPTAAGTSPGEPEGRVLLLEPDPESRQILAAALGETFQVVSAMSAEEAREAWAEGEWAGCIVEPRVPGGGAALVQQLRANQNARGAAILVYSTSTVAAETAAWRAAGADSCLGKPARTRVLLQRLQTIRNRRNRR